MKKKRLTRKQYYMEIALLTAKRGTCPRAQVGAIAVKDKHVIMSAYNGSPPDCEHCSDAGCLMVEGHCIRTIHAEANLITTCARLGIALRGATVYVTHEPCANCTKLLISSGISRVIYGSPRLDSNMLEEYSKLIIIKNVKEVNDDGR